MRFNLSKWLFELLFAQFIRNFVLEIGDEVTLPDFKTRIPGNVYVENAGPWRLRRYK